MRGAPIALARGLSWLPVTDDEIDRMAEETTLPWSPWDGRFVHFGSVVPALVSELSMHGPVAYIETDFFGGVGKQVATAFARRVRVLECGSVNAALRAIGVQADRGLDEWDTVGLPSHRYMPDDDMPDDDMPDDD